MCIPYNLKGGSEKVKKFTVIILICISILISCSSTKEKSKDKYDDSKVINIGFLIHTNEAGLSNSLKDLVLEYIQEKKNINLHILDLKSNNIGTQKAVDIFVNKNIQALIVVEQNSANHENIIENLQPTNIPVLFVHYIPNKELLPTYPLLFSFSSDNIKVGEMQAQFLIVALKEKGIENGNIGIITGTLGDPRQIERTQGFLDYLKEYGPGLVVTQSSSANWKKSEAITVVETWLKSDELVAIIANNNAMALGATIPLREQEIEEIVLVGAGGTDIEETFKSIERGHINATIYTDFNNEILTSIEIAKTLGTNQSSENLTSEYGNKIKRQLVTQENINQLR